MSNAVLCPTAGEWGVGVVREAVGSVESGCGCAIPKLPGAQAGPLEMRAGAWGRSREGDFRLAAASAVTAAGGLLS